MSNLFNHLANNIRRTFLFLLILLLSSCYLKDGQVTYHHENGNKSMEGSYKKGQRDGIWHWWHENGQMRGEGVYNDVDYRLINYWNSEGKLLVEKGNGTIIWWHEDEKLKRKEEPIKDGKTHGMCTYWDKTGKIEKKEYYENGELIRTES